MEQSRESADSLAIRAVQMAQRGQLAEAEGLLRRAIALNPAIGAYHVNLGMVLSHLGRKQDAIEAFREALRRQPESPEALNNLALMLQEQGPQSLVQAIEIYQRAVALRPQVPELHNNLATALLQSGRYEEAEAAVHRALGMRPDYPEAHYNLGNVLRARGRAEQAIEPYRRAVTLRPAYAEAWCNLGHSLGDVHRLDEAVEAYRKALSLGFDRFELHANLAVALKDMGELDESLAEFQRALALTEKTRIDPASVSALHAHLAVPLKEMGELDQSLDSFRRALSQRADADVESGLLCTLHYHPDTTPEQLAEAHRHWNQVHARPLASRILPHENDPNPQRRLRVGYVSPDFRHHPVGFFLLPLLANHNHTDFEIFGYSDVKNPDAITQKLRACADVWRETSRLSDEELARQIRSDRIDVLVDLTMHLSGSRLLAFARKPAPVQVTYLAYCGTTGLETMDYRLTDSYLDPPGTDESIYSEKTVRLRSYWCYPQPEEAPEVGPLPSATTGHITFGCLNNYCKVTRATWEAWRELLTRVPDSRLKVHAAPGAHRQRAMNMLSAAGMDPKRLQFVGFQPRADYFRQYHQIDIALDPFPYTGGTTTCDALWMGAPVVSLAGQTAVSRGGSSILSQIGLSELVARDREQYVQVAVNLAKDHQRLQALHSTLRQRMRGSPLMDAPGFARDLESAFRTMWREWCESEH